MPTTEAATINADLLAFKGLIVTPGNRSPAPYQTPGQLVSQSQFSPSDVDLVQARPVLYRQHTTRDAPLRQIERGDMTPQISLLFLNL
jgi:hypothetical protein